MKKLQIILMSLMFFPMILVESFSADIKGSDEISKLKFLQKIDDVIKTEDSPDKKGTLESIKLTRDKAIEARNVSQNDISVNNKRDSQIIYTIQTGSFVSLERAQKQFYTLIQRLNQDNNKHLRIEKVGEVYSVRLGSFKDYLSAKKFLMSVKSQLNAKAFILKAFIEVDRIIRSRKDIILSTR